MKIPTFYSQGTEMTLDQADNPRERVLEELEYLASLEAKTGDERALRVVKRLRALLSKPKEAEHAA